MGGKELYENFMRKLKQEQHYQSFREKADNKKRNIKIEIQLKGATTSGTKTLDESMMKVIQNEYAVRYLEQLGLQPTQTNIEKVLKNAPLSSCEFQAVWNNSGWIADSITIYPSKPNKKTFDIQREEMLEQQKKKPKEEKQRDEFNFKAIEDQLLGRNEDKS